MDIAIFAHNTPKDVMFMAMIKCSRAQSVHGCDHNAPKHLMVIAMVLNNTPKPRLVMAMSRYSRAQ